MATQGLRESGRIRPAGRVRTGAGSRAAGNAWWCRRDRPRPATAPPADVEAESCRQLVDPGNRHHRRHVEGPREHPQPIEQLTLRRVEQGVGPVHRLFEGLVPARHRPAGPAEQGEPPVQHTGDLERASSTGCGRRPARSPTGCHQRQARVRARPPTRRRPPPPPPPGPVPGTTPEPHDPGSSGRTGRTNSPSSARASRLVASTCTPAHRDATSSTSEATSSTRCSQLSITMRARRWASAEAIDSAGSPEGRCGNTRSRWPRRRGRPGRRPQALGRRTTRYAGKPSAQFGGHLQSEPGLAHPAHSRRG